jgi:hypothetical protein
MSTLPSGQSSESITTNKNYLVRVSQGGAGSGLNIVANATAKLSLQIENHWVNIMEALGFSLDMGFVGQAISSAVNAGQIITGNNFLPTWATSHVWRGSSGIEVSLDMRFDAWVSSATDVVLPVKQLVRMFSPTRSNLGGKASSSGNFLHPPGPTPWEYFIGGDPNVAVGTITIVLGNALTITNLIPVALHWEFENRFDASGAPITALVNATFMSFTLPTQEDVLAFFMTPGSDPSNFISGNS